MSVDSSFKLVLLGTRAGPPADQHRTGIATAVVVDGNVYMVDCGRSAVTQYVKSGLRFDALRGIFLTHLHADHIADYYNFILLAGNSQNRNIDPVTGLNDTLSEKIGVWGPGAAGGLPEKFGGGSAPTVGEDENPTPGTREMTMLCHRAYAYSSNLFLRDMGIRDPRSLADVNDIAIPDIGADFQNRAPDMEPFVVMDDGVVRVSAILVPHGPVYPAFAFRFDCAYGSVTFSGDTAYSSNLIRLADSSDVLVHEALNLEGWDSSSPVFFDHLLQSHVEVQKVGDIAAKARCGKLVLSHIADMAENPIPVDKWQRWAQSGYDGEVVVGEDLLEVPIA